MLKTLTALISLLVLPFFCLVLEAQENESCYSLELESFVTDAAEPFCIAVKANGFDELLSFQWSIKYDPTVLEFIEVTDFELPGLSSANFGSIFEGSHGASFGTSWTSPSFSGTELEESDVLFSICFQPLVEAGSTYIEFFDAPTPLEIVSVHGENLSLSLTSAEIVIGEEIAEAPKIEQICIEPGTCESLGAASIHVLMNGRETSFTYRWVGLEEFTTNSPVYEAPTPGLYQLEVTDSNGAKVRANVYVSESIRERWVSDWIEPVPCDQEIGGSITLTLRNTDEEYQFSWSNGETSQSLQDLEPGVYTVTITDTGTGCQALEKFQVDHRELLGAIETGCAGIDEAKVRALLFGIGQEPLTFDWSTGETFIGTYQHEVQFSLLEYDSYAVTITSEDNCSIVLEGELPNCSTSVAPLPVYDDCLMFEIEKAEGEPGEIVCTDVKVRGFRDITSCQYTLQWNPLELEFKEVKNFNLGLRPINFGTMGAPVVDGKLTTVWFDLEGPRGETLADGETLYTVCFEALDNSGFSPIEITDDPTPIEIVWAKDPVAEFRAIPVNFISGGIDIGGSAPLNPPVFAELCVDKIGCGDTGLERVSTSITGGVPPYNYHWEGPESFFSQAPDFEAPTLGVYFLTVTDAVGTEATATVQVRDIDVYPDTFAEITPVSCDASNDGSIRLLNIVDPGAYSFEWSTGETNRDIFYLAAEEYTVTITENGRNCTTIKSYDVGPEEIRAALYYSCSDSLSADVSASVLLGGTEEYTFSWSNGVVEIDSQLSTIEVLEGDSINVSITNNRGCTYVSQVIFPVCSEAPINDGFATSYAYNCSETGQGAVVTAYVWDNPQGPYTFAWSTGFIEDNTYNSSISVAVENSYSVTITDASGAIEVLGDIKPNCDDRVPEPIILSIGEANATSGESICLAVRVDNFTNILGLQYAVSWDPDLLELESLQNFSLPNLDESSYDFGESNYQNGQLHFSWLDLTGVGVTLPNDASIYEMCFIVTGNEGEARISFDQESIQAEFVNEEIEAESPFLNDGLIIINGEERVWPGDTDKNKITNHYDLLNLGLTYGATGPIREDANLSWQGQWATDWGQLTPNTAIDYKHIDTNGDGIINSADTTAISLNWGRAVNLVPNPMEEYRSSTYEIKTQGAPIYIEAFPALPGERVSFNINLGDSENPVEGAYGLAFSIVYDPLAVVYGSVKASFEQSWLGELDTDMIALSKDDPNQHRLHIGLSRIDQMEVDGSGAIGQISMTIEDVIFRNSEYEMPFRVENVRLIRANEEEVQVTQKQTIGVITDTPLAVEDFSIASRIRLYPNPTRDVINIQYESLRMDRVQLLNLEGQILKEYSTVSQISLSDQVPSTYILRFIGVDGVALKKVVKFQ